MTNFDFDISDVQHPKRGNAEQKNLANELFDYLQEPRTAGSVFPIERKATTDAKRTGEVYNFHAGEDGTLQAFVQAPKGDRLGQPKKEPAEAGARDNPIDTIEALRRLGEDTPGLKKDLSDSAGPSAKDVQNASDMARENLEKQQLFKLLPPADREALLKLQDAVLKGDTKALAEIVKRLKDNPEKLEAMAHAIEKNLQKSGAQVNLDVTEDGRLLVYGKDQKHALEVRPDGKTAVRPIEVHADGSVEVIEGRTLIRPKAQEVAKRIGNGAVSDVTALASWRK